MCVCVCVYACMRVCVRMHACTHARTHARKHARTHARQVPRFGQGACGRMHSRLLLLFLGAPLRGLALRSCRIHQQGSLRLSLCSPRRTRGPCHMSAHGVGAGAQDAAAECIKLSSSMIDLRGAAADHVGKTANIPPQPAAPAVTRALARVHRGRGLRSGQGPVPVWSRNALARSCFFSTHVASSCNRDVREPQQLRAPVTPTAAFLAQAVACRA